MRERSSARAGISRVSYNAIVAAAINLSSRRKRHIVLQNIASGDACSGAANDIYARAYVVCDGGAGDVQNTAYGGLSNLQAMTRVVADRAVIDDPDRAVDKIDTDAVPA